MSHLTIQQLVAQNDGELTGPSLTLVERHVSECEACWRELELLAEQDALLASVMTIDPGDAFFEDLAAGVEAEMAGRKKPAPRAAARPATPPAPAPPAPAPRPKQSPRPPEPVATPEPMPRSEAASPPEPEGTSRLVEPGPARPFAASEPVADPEPAPPPSVTPEPAPEPEPETPAPATAGPPPGLEPPASAPATPPAEPQPIAGLESRPRIVPPARPAGAALPVDRYDFTPAPERLNTEPVGSGTPLPPPPDDLFADLAMPTRPSGPRKAPAASEPAARVTPAKAPPRVEPPPARTPAPPPRVEPPAPRVEAPRARAAARPVEAVAAPPPAAPAPVAGAAADESRPKRSMTPILIGIAAFLAGIIVAVVVVLRIGALGARSPERAAVVAPAVNPAPAAPEPARAAPVETPPRVQVEVAPRVTPAPVAARPAARPKPRVRPQNPDDGAALNSPSTTMIPTRTIRTEEVVPATPTAPAPAPPAPPPPTELGVLCGLVKDSDGRPVARAQVMMADVGVVVLTDRAGHFCLTAPTGERTLSVVALGFTTSRRLVTLAKRTPELDVTLKSAAPFPTPR